MCLCLLCSVRDGSGVYAGGYVHLLELILPVVRKRAILDHRGHLQQKKKRHAAHTAQSRPRVRSDACRMGHPRRRVTVRPGPDTGLPTVVARIFDQITTETGRASRLDLFGIPALLERLEGDPEISKATVSVR
jgi:hypothetical protein